MEQKELLPLNLQLFAEETETEVTTDETVETDENVQDEVNEDAEKATNTDKVIEKLQKRLGKEQADKNETKTRLEQALARIEELEKGSKKSVKEKSDEEKTAELQKAKDEEIATLKNKIKLAEVTSQADEILKDSGLALKSEELALLVNVDDEKTYANVKTLLNLLERERVNWEKVRNTGVTPKKAPQNKPEDVFKKAANKYL